MIKIHNVETGKITEREMNADELAKYESGKAAAEVSEAEFQAKRAAKASAESKLAALGLTADEIAALLP